MLQVASLAHLHPIAGRMPGRGTIKDGGYSVASDWFFQMVFCATTASIVSGTVAERVKLWPFLLFVVVLTGFIYPIIGAWKWGAGWLASGADTSWIKSVAGAEFQDFAGSTLVHSTGGWAALTGAIIIGARTGKFQSNGMVHPIPGSNMPLATLGTFILWLGWFGFNGGSQLAMGTVSDAADVSRIFVNTNLAAAAGVVVAILLNQLVYGKVDLTFALNGALAGLVAITAETAHSFTPMGNHHWWYRWRDRRIYRPAARQDENRRCRWCHSSSSDRWHLGNNGCSANQ